MFVCVSHSGVYVYPMWLKCLEIPNPLARSQLILLARIWRTFWLDHFDGNPPETICDTLRLIEPQIFPNIHACLKTLGTMPATSYECERSITKMGLVLTDKRGTMGQERFKRFNSLVLLSVHKDICLSADEVIDEFAKNAEE